MQIVPADINVLYVCLRDCSLSEKKVFSRHIQQEQDISVMKEIINCYDAKCPVLILRMLAMFLALKFSVLSWTLHGNVPLHHCV